jgi:hypothetical protein
VGTAPSEFVAERLKTLCVLSEQLRAGASKRVLVSPFVEFRFLDESSVNEIIEIRVETAVIDLHLKLVFKPAFDCEP